MNNSNNGGFFFMMLGVLFIGLKLTGYISWSWVWVLSPLWLPYITIFFAIFFGVMAYTIFKGLRK